MARLIVEFYPFRIQRDQGADKRLLPCVRMMSSNFHALAAYRGKMLKLAQRTIQSRRRNLQGVTSLYRVINIQQITQNRAQFLQIVKTDPAARPIDQEPQQRVPCPLVIIHRDQLVAVPLDVRLQEFRNLCAHRVQRYNVHPLRLVQHRNSRNFLDNSNKKVGAEPTHLKKDTSPSASQQGCYPQPINSGVYLPNAGVSASGPSMIGGRCAYRGLPA